MTYFNFKKENQRKEVNKKIILFLVSLVVLQNLISAYKDNSEIKLTDESRINTITKVATN